MAAKQIHCNASILFAEALALREEVKQAISLGFSHLIIEGDNLAVINAIRNIRHIPWEIHGLIRDSKMDLDKVDYVVINHSFRETNKTTDYLANLCHNFRSMICLLHLNDSNLSLIIHQGINITNCFIAEIVIT